jgi:DNA gyrase subunit B
MDVTVWRDGYEYNLHFERGEIVGQLEKTELAKNQKKKTGTRTR